MGWDGPQEACPACGWQNFRIRTQCRHCGCPLREQYQAEQNLMHPVPSALDRLATEEEWR